MDKTVWKFQIGLGQLTVDMPKGSKVLSVGMQDSVFCIWALCDPDPTAPTEQRRFRIVGTGHPLNPEFHHQFIGTILEEKPYVWHIFELTP